MNMVGDGFVVMFISLSVVIVCVDDIVDVVVVLGIEVWIGIYVGEVEVCDVLYGIDVVGVVVYIGVCVCVLVGFSEVLVFLIV